MSNIYYWEKLKVLKTCRERKFVGKKIWRTALAWKIKRYKTYSGKRLSWDYCLQMSFVYKTLSQIFLNFFCLEIKGFYESSCGNKADFRDIMNVSRISLVKIWNFQKVRHDFVNERALITAKLISSCHWKTLLYFSLQKKRPEKAFLTLIVNYCKILQKNKLCHPKQQ